MKTRLSARHRQVKKNERHDNTAAIQEFRQYQRDIQNSKSTINTNVHDNASVSTKRTASQFTYTQKNKRGLSGTLQGSKPWPSELDNQTNLARNAADLGNTGTSNNENPLNAATEHTGRSAARSFFMGGDAVTSAEAQGEGSQEDTASLGAAPETDEGARKERVQQILELQKSDPESFQMVVQELINQAEM